MDRLRTFVIEAVDSIDGGALMVSAQQEEVFWVLDFVSQQQTNGLQALSYHKKNKMRECCLAVRFQGQFLCKEQAKAQRRGYLFPSVHVITQK